MGARPKYIAKYITGYRTHFPDAAILLIQCPVAAVFQRDATAQHGLRPARDIVLDAFEREPQRRVVLHAFSNGGATLATRLARTLHEHPAPPRAGRESTRRLPFGAYLFDCMPGKPDIGQAVHAFTVGLASPWRFLAAAVLRVVLLCYMLVNIALRLTDMLTRLRGRLNDPALLDADVPRLYLYSRADRLVGYRAIEEHAAEARAMGFAHVREESFTSSAHCALPVEDPGRYWRAVTEHVSGK